MYCQQLNILMTFDFSSNLKVFEVCDPSAPMYPSPSNYRTLYQGVSSLDPPAPLDREHTPFMLVDHRTTSVLVNHCTTSVLVEHCNSVIVY